MASMELPPRRSRKLNEITIQRNRSSLEVLQQMGFPKHRAEKSLAATGDKGVQLASDWLISHINDPTLDDKGVRDYILYLCPVGQLQQELMDFWQKSYQECGWNRAHNYFPHITLCSFFKADDTMVSQLSHGLKMVADRNGLLPLETMELDYFSSANFIGLFVTEKYAQLLKQITAEFAEEATKYGVSSLEPHKKQLHCSLAYQFPPEKKEKLENLAKSINMQVPVRWDLRLYSKDQRINNCQVRKVLFTYQARAHDELDLIDGDFIFFDEAEVESSTDGWYMGTSWLTGCTGLFAGSYTERTAESETWTMHRSIPIVGTELGTKPEVNGPVLPEGICNTQAPRMQRRIASLTASPTKPSRSTAKALPTVSEVNSTDSPKVDRKPSSSSSSSSSSQMPNPGAVASSSNSSLSSLTESPTKSSRQQTASPSQGQSRSGQMSSQSQRSQAETEHHYQALQPVRQESFDERTLMDGSRGSPKPARRKFTAENATPATASKGPRQLYVVRHGERIDFTFGKDWIQNSFNQSGNYVRYDLNMPKSLPKRKGGPQDFSKDSPLTVQGHFQGRLVGEAMKEKGISFSHVYASPSLRCVETASSLMEGLGEEHKIHIESGLFEWLGWYTSGLPKFMTPQELADCGFNIDLSHSVIWPVSKYNIQESTEQYYDRCYNVTKEILKRHEHEGGNVLVVAHAASLDVCTRQLVGQPARTHSSFHDVLHKVPYCALSVAQEACLVRDTWYLIEPPVLPFAHANNPKYNWTCLTTPSI